MKHSILYDDVEKLKEMLELRQQGWSSPKLGQKYKIDHTTILAICKKYGLEKLTKDKIIKIEKDRKECIQCLKKFTPNTKRHIYCSRECKNVAYFGVKKIPPPKTMLDERDEKICLGYNYADYFAKAYPDPKKRKAIMRAEKWRGGGLPHKTMSEYKKERDKLTDQRIKSELARQERLAGITRHKQE